MCRPPACGTIFGQSAPLNIPYEFFLVGGAKMSSSKGIGVSARDMADFLPPEILRFVMIRTQPKQPVNFSPDEKSVIKIFNDFDRFHTRTYHDPKVSPDDRRVYQLSQIACPRAISTPPTFSWWQRLPSCRISIWPARSKSAKARR